MKVNEILQQLWAAKEKNTIITDKDGNIVYTSKICEAASETVTEHFKGLSDETDELEFFDKSSGKYLRVSKYVTESDGKPYICYTFTDISEFTDMVKEVAAYTRSLREMSKFQTSVMKHLSMPYDTFMPGLAEYCNSEDIIMFKQTDGNVVKSVYNGKISRTSLGNNDEYARFFNVGCNELIDGYRCVVQSQVQGSRYSVFVKHDNTHAVNDFIDSSIHNVISLFIENSILRDHIIYESEHDKLTGLYNKGKYMALKNESFGRPETIAIYNFDVNNLKYINDNFGHEYGDALIVKAAKSIAAVTSDKVLGFRMGGDEYVMVGLGLTKEQAENVRLEWKQALDRLNDEDDGIFCAMACGLAFGSGDYDYDELYAQADKSMYVDKKELKVKNIGSHLKENKRTEVQ